MPYRPLFLCLLSLPWSGCGPAPAGTAETRRFFLETGDPLGPEQWHLDTLGVEAAWRHTKGSAEITIAVLDSGVSMDHPDLPQPMVWPRDTLEGDDDPSPDPGDGHGTRVAGLTAALAGNGLGIAGLCPGCSLMPIRVMGNRGFVRLTALAEGIRWAAAHGARVLVISLGPGAARTVRSETAAAIAWALEEAPGAAGRVVIVAAGNEARPLQDQELAALPQVWAIGATDEEDRRTEHSNGGPHLGLMAPAANLTTDLSGASGGPAPGYTDAFGGTSAAAATAAGLTGLLFSAHPGLSRDQAWDILRTTAHKVGELEYPGERNDDYGYGLAHAAGALEEARRRSLGATDAQGDAEGSGPWLDAGPNADTEVALPSASESPTGCGCSVDSRPLLPPWSLAMRLVSGRSTGRPAGLGP